MNVCRYTYFLDSNSFARAARSLARSLHTPLSLRTPLSSRVRTCAHLLVHEPIILEKKSLAVFMLVNLVKNKQI